MKVCGVEISGQEARLAVVSLDEEGSVIWHKSETKKIRMNGDRFDNSITSFHGAMKAFAHENGVEIFAIKARATKGKMAGGAVSFKIEALIQFLNGSETVFVNSVALSNFSKKNEAGLPLGMAAYLQNAYLSGAYCLIKGK